MSIEEDVVLRLSGLVLSVLSGVRLFYSYEREFVGFSLEFLMFAR